MRPSIGYLIATILIFLTEVGIAKFATDSFVRPFLGDAIVVVLMYVFLRTFLRFDYRIIALACLGFAYFVEMLQAWNVGQFLGLKGVWLIVLGSTFDPMDLVAYSVGCMACLLLDPWKKR